MEPRLEIGAEGRVVRLREMFESFIESERSAVGQPSALKSSRSLTSLPGSESENMAALWRPVEIHTLEQQVQQSRSRTPPAANTLQQDVQQVWQQAMDAPGDSADSRDRTDAGTSRSRASPQRSLSSSAAAPALSAPPDMNRAQFEAVLRYFEGLRDGLIVDGASRPAGGRGSRGAAGLGWPRRRWPSGARFDLRRVGLRRSLGALLPPLSPATADDDGDGLGDAERVVLAAAPAESPAPAPRVMAEYPYLSRRRSRPRLVARGLIPHQELVRRARDRVVVFGPGLFHGTVGSDNTFQVSAAGWRGQNSTLFVKCTKTIVSAI